MPMIGKRAGTLVERNKDNGSEIFKHRNRKGTVMYFVWQAGSSIGLLRNSLALAREAAGIAYTPPVVEKGHGSREEHDAWLKANKGNKVNGGKKSA